MPISKYYKGHGEEVMSDMKQRYGGDKGESVFYATANKKGMKPKGKKRGGKVKKTYKKGGKVTAQPNPFQGMKMGGKAC